MLKFIIKIPQFGLWLIFYFLTTQYNLIDSTANDSNLLYLIMVRPSQPTRTYKLKLPYYAKSYSISCLKLNYGRFQFVFSVQTGYLVQTDAQFVQPYKLSFFAKITHNTTQKMQLSYDNRLLHLANAYNNVLLHHTSSRSKYYSRNCSYFINRKKRKREEEKKEEKLREIEDWLLVGRGLVSGSVVFAK